MIRAHKKIAYPGLLLLLVFVGSCLLVGAKPPDYLKYSLAAKPGDLQIVRMPASPTRTYSEEFTFTVNNPMKSDFNGSSPNCQTFEVEVFFIGTDKETSVWKWSSGQMFCQHVTPVPIPSVQSWEKKAVWTFKPDTVQNGKYRAVATFIPTGNKEAGANFQITSVH
jgi:hypothetical protein